MNDWPLKVIGIEKDSGSIFFFPKAAKARGYIVHPLVEIGPADIIDALSVDFKVNTNYFYLANIIITLSESRVLSPLRRPINLATMHRSHFLNEILSGIYLEAVFISDTVLLFMLGDEEAWIVLDAGHHQQTSPKLEHLISISRANIKVLRKSEQFESF